MATTNQSALGASVALTNALVEVRKRIGDHLLVKPGDPDIARLENLGKQAGLAITSLTGEIIKLLGAETATALTQLKKATERGKAFIGKLRHQRRDRRRHLVSDLGSIRAHWGRQRGSQCHRPAEGCY
jgi:hypothetical protein